MLHALFAARSSTRSASLALAVSAVFIGGIASNAQASLPVFGGPGGPFGSGSVIGDPDANFINTVNNVGTAFGRGSLTFNGISNGTHSFYWSPTGAVTRFNGIGPVALPSSVYAMTNDGAAYGNGSVMNGDLHPVRYAPGSYVPQEMATLSTSSTGHAYATAYAVNASYTSVGESTLFNGGNNLGKRAVRWDGAGNITPLNPLNYSSNGTTDSSAGSINANGTILGIAGKWNDTGTTNLGTRAMRWANGSVNGFELDTPFFRNDGLANVGTMNVNAGGSALGYVEKWSGSNSQGRRAVRWASGGTAATVLDVLGTDVNGVTQALPLQITDSGDVVGMIQKYSSSNVDLGFRAVRWNAGGTAITELDSLPGVNPQANGYSIAYRENRLGTVAGSSEAAGLSETHATIWPAGGTAAVDLNTLLSPKSTWTLYEATSISDTGFVTGIGQFDPDGLGPKPSYPELYTMLVPQAGTYGKGDANFDTKVNFDDLIILAQHYNQTNTSQATNVGDFNLDGAVNFEDLIALAQNYNKSFNGALTSGSSDFATDWALAQSLVPEPTTLGATLCVLATCGTRRRRQSR